MCTKTKIVIVESSVAGQRICFKGIDGLGDIERYFVKANYQFSIFVKDFDPKNVNYPSFAEYSAKLVNAKLFAVLNSVVP